MNKTIQVNIGGRVFFIEEAAYAKLQIYLGAIREYFAKREGADEIVNDIELRLTELFQERLTLGREVVTEADVDYVIGIMGTVEDYINADESGEEEPGSEKSAHRLRRLYRNPDDKVLFGVCSGISAYFGWDPLILRLVTIGAVVFFGTGIMLYIILAIIMPKAKTTAEKLQMRGEPVTVENISKKVKENINDIGADINNLGKTNFGKSNVNGLFNNIGKFIGDLIGYLLKAMVFIMKLIGRVFGAIFILAGISAIVVSIVVLFGIETWMVQESLPNLSFGNSIWPLDEIFSLPEFNKTMFYFGAALTMIMPAFGLLILGFRLLFRMRALNPWFGVGGVIIWFVGITLVFASMHTFYREYSVRSEVEKKLSLDHTSPDTLFVKIASNELIRTLHENYESSEQNPNVILGYSSTNGIFKRQVQLSAGRNKSGDWFELIAEMSALGNDRNIARENATGIKTDMISKGDTLWLAEEFTLVAGTKLRQQQLSYHLQIPIGKTVHFAPETAGILQDMPNVNETYFVDMANHYWTMTQTGLVCTDCKALVDGVSTENEVEYEQEILIP